MVSRSARRRVAAVSVLVAMASVPALPAHARPMSLRSLVVVGWGDVVGGGGSGFGTVVESQGVIGGTIGQGTYEKRSVESCDPSSPQDCVEFFTATVTTPRGTLTVASQRIARGDIAYPFSIVSGTGGFAGLSGKGTARSTPTSLVLLGRLGTGTSGPLT